MSLLVVCPLSDLDAVVARYSPSHLLTVISPDMPVETPIGISPDNHLTLHFNDIGRPTHGLTAATSNDIERMIAFAQSWDQTAPMVIHCWMGVSRSTASAMAVLATLQPRRREHDIAAELRFLAPFASPNPRIIALADTALSRNGRLISAAQSIGIGQDCWQGTPFEMDVSQLPD